MSAARTDPRSFKLQVLPTVSRAAEFHEPLVTCSTFKASLGLVHDGRFTQGVPRAVVVDQRTGFLRGPASLAG